MSILLTQSKYTSSYRGKKLCNFEFCYIKMCFATQRGKFT